MPSFFKKSIPLTIINVVIALFLIVWFISSPIAKYYLTPALAPYNLNLSEDTSIRYNLFMSKVTISDLALSTTENQKNETVFSLKELALKVTLFDLLFDEITISEATFDEGFIKIVRQGDDITIAGVTLPANEEKETSQSQETGEEPAVFPYTVKMPLLSLSNFTIDVSKTSPEQTKEKLHQLVFNALTIKDVSANLIEQSAKIIIDADIDNTELALDVQANLVQQQGDIVANLAINNYPLAKLSPYLDDINNLQGTLSFNSQQTISIEENSLTVLLSQGEIDNSMVSFIQSNQQLSIADFKQEFSNMKLAVDNGNITQLEGNSQLSISNIAITLLDQTQSQQIGDLLSVGSLAIDDISFHFVEQPIIKLASITVNDIVGSHIKTSDKLASLPPIATIKQLAITNTAITPKDIAIDTITLDTITSDIIINEDKVLVNLVSDNTQETANNKNDVTLEEPSDEVVSQTGEVSEPFFFSLNKFELLNGSKTVVNDKSVEPVVTRTLFLETLSLGSLNNKSNKPQKTPFSIAGKSNKYANFKLDGTIDPFIDIPSYKITGYFNELSLPAISSYIKDAAQLEIKTGQLSTNIDVTLIGEQLDGNLALHLQGLETGLVDSHEAGSLIEQGALPLNMALGMLKDRDGAVELDVPVSGSTSDPQFGLHSILTIITQKAIMSATQDYLLTTFVPYANIVSVAITAGEFALKLRFDDLLYQVKQIEPSVEQKAFLDEFIALMKDKDDTKVTICAISVSADIDQKPGQAITDKALIKQLKDLGEQREHAFKDYIIEHGGVESSRLLLCAPKIDTDVDAKPRIALSV
ncbi:DUF748 domain-containing protein [Colwellia sp. RSH04]|uniref:DUF748 domain-containing protein n=1 Tax=Colwellia sp. RSH04 TaxID=2305464 RepID=UPI000E592409|nr:DUF748 domain-containing protein [Colwellia sp. RSH04]RHW77983.1 DUF748 domain-containing protein [Colwellia sp. RSH04]